MLKVIVELKSCRDCHHLDHSGSFTVRGLRWICGHPNACKKRVSIEDFLAEYPEYRDRDITYKSWKYHWIHRCITKSSKEEPKEIPHWCPLKEGNKY